MHAANLRWKTKNCAVRAIQYCSFLIFVKTGCFLLLTLMMLYLRELLSFLIVLVSFQALQIVAKKTLMFVQQSF